MSVHEERLVDRIAAAVALRPGTRVGIGDDAAVLDGDPPTVVSTDLLVDGVHFRRTTTSLADLGHKALAVSLSDVAAMGARPVAAVVALTLPERDPLGDGDVDALYAGMEALAARHGVTIAGGDLSAGPALALAVTALGTMAPGVAPARRDGARAGDLVCVTGALGAAAAGLALLEEPERAGALARTVAEALRAAYRRPEPRVAAGAALAAGGVHALMDCSDGLALDVARLARASGLAAVIDLDAVPIAPGASAEDAIAGGEDYELIAAVAPADLARVRAALDVLLTAVGRLAPGPPGVRVERAGAPVPLARLGYQHALAGG